VTDQQLFDIILSSLEALVNITNFWLTKY